MIRAKFTLVTIAAHANNSAKTLAFTPQYDTSIPEDARFAKATPSGELRMYVDNPAALERFTLGESYYVDFTPVSRPIPEPAADLAATE